MEVYTYGVWKTKPGKEQQFVAAWRELGEWTLEKFPDAAAGTGTLLQDRDDPTLFASFGPWQSKAAVQQWRADPGFQDRVAAMRGLLESFEPHMMEEVARVEK